MALRADERRDKLRKASGRSKYPLIRRSLNGETYLSAPQVTYGEYIAIRREPGELKHLSSRRKRKKTIDFQSSGERNGRSPNRDACIPGLWTTLCDPYGNGTVWEVRPERVKVPYMKPEGS